MTAWVAFGVLAGVSVGLLAALWWTPTRRFHRRPQVIVNLVGGQAFQGVLWRGWGRYYVLKGAALVDGGGETPVDGEVVIERSRVDFVQVT